MEFVSGLEKYMEAEELSFPYAAGFGPYNRFLGHALLHPNKNNVYLVEFLIEKYSEPGDLILDPMAGTGSTCVIAVLKGRNAVCVDIEPRFYEWMETARRKVESARTLTGKGVMVNVLGDARKLSKLVNARVDAIVTSPPYMGSNPKTVDSDMIKYLMSMRKGRLVLDQYMQYEHPGNVGRLEGEGYYASMAVIYGEMFKVLKPGGVAAVMVSPVYREKKVVDLPLSAWVSMKNVGFELLKVYKSRFKIKNYYRQTWYPRHFPDVPVIAHEYVVVVVKK